MAQATRRGILAVVTAIVLLALGAGVGVVLGDALGIRTEPSAQMTPAAPVAPASATVVLPPEFTEEEIEMSRQRTLVKRLGQPEDVSRVIAMLIEHEYLTGHVYFIDGGQMFSH